MIKRDRRSGAKALLQPTPRLPFNLRLYVCLRKRVASRVTSLSLKPLDPWHSVQYPSRVSAAVEHIRPPRQSSSNDCNQQIVAPYIWGTFKGYIWRLHTVHGIYIRHIRLSSRQLGFMQHAVIRPTKNNSVENGQNKETASKSKHIAIYQWIYYTTIYDK